MKIKKVLVTGAGGYIGSIATDLLLQKGFEVIAIDNLSRGYLQPIEFLQNKYGRNNLRFYKMDISHNISSIFEKEKNIDAIIHYAALCNVDESMKKPDLYFSNNICGSQNIFSHMVRHDIKFIIFSSTAAVYGKPQHLLVTEDDKLDPISPYGQSKKIVEQILETYGRQHVLRYVILRYFNVTGASDDGLLGDSKKPSTLLIQNVVRASLGIEPFYLTYSPVATKDKTPVRDFINVVDLNIAHIKALDYLANGGTNEVINLGTAKGYSIAEILSMCEKITGITLTSQYSILRKGEIPAIVATNEKAKRILRWKTKHSIENSIRSLLLWYTKHPNGWDY